MPSGVRDIQLLELKDTISQLNNTISTQNELIRSLQKMLQERDAKDSEKDQLIANLQAQLDYLKTRLFGSTSEIRHEQLPGQLDLFHLQTEDEPEPVPLDVEYIEVKAHKKARKSKAAYDEVFADLPTENVYVDTLTEEQKTCDVCGTMMVPIGHEPIRTELRYTEPKLERIDYYATTYECPQCKETEDPRFIKDEETPALIPGSYALIPSGTTKCRRHSVVVAGLTYDAIGCGQYPKATKRIIHIRQSRDSYTVISCLSMNDLIEKKDYRSNRFIIAA